MIPMKPTPPDSDIARSWQPITLALILGACVLTALLRMKLIDVPWNLTPVGALALFAGASGDNVLDLLPPYGAIPGRAR